MQAVVKLAVLAAVLAVAAAQTEQELQERKGGLKHKYYSHLMLQMWPWLFAAKVKVVVVAVAIALAIGWGAKLWLPGWGCSQGYSASPGWQEEYPGTYSGKSYSEERSARGEGLAITARVMRGLDLAELSYRAAIEADPGRECRTRLTCEARHMAQDSAVVERMLDMFSSTLAQFDSGRAADCEQLGCELVTGPRPASRRRAAPPAQEQPPSNQPDYLGGQPQYSTVSQQAGFKPYQTVGYPQ